MQDLMRTFVLTIAAQFICTLTIVYASLGAYDRRFPFRKDEKVSVDRLVVGLIVVVIVTVLVIRIPQAELERNPLALPSYAVGSIVATFVAILMATWLSKLDDRYGRFTRPFLTCMVAAAAFYVTTSGWIAAYYPKNLDINPYFSDYDALAKYCIIPRPFDNEGWLNLGVIDKPAATVGDSSLVRLPLWGGGPVTFRKCLHPGPFFARADLEMTGGQVENIDGDIKQSNKQLPMWGWRITPTRDGTQYVHIRVFTAKSVAALKSPDLLP